jgi:zinc transport system ATP-binding protein
MHIECHPDKKSISFEQLSFSYGEENILSDISFTIPDGDYVALVGPNGGGKSTLLKLLLGLLKTNEGCITVFGHSVEKAKEHLDIGYVPQRIVSSEVALPATVEEVVRSACVASHGFFSSIGEKEKAAAEKAMEELGILDLKKKQVNQLSGGQRQRVFIARALARRPKVLILDEPTVGVDVQVKEKFFELLAKLNAQGITILIVSHDIDIMKERAKTIVGIHRRLICHMSSKDFDAHEFSHNLYEIPHH